MKHLKRYNEELAPGTYANAADKLRRMGHKRRPAELEEWADVVRKRNLEAKKARVLAESKKLGQFKFKIITQTQVKYGNYYPYFEINYAELEDQKLQYLNHGSSYYLPISMGLIPVDKEDREILFLFEQGNDVSESNTGVYWVQDIYFNLSIAQSSIDRFLEGLPIGLSPSTDTAFLKHLKKENSNNKLNPINHGEIIPSGHLSIESNICNEIYLGDRLNAIKFRKMLIKLFEGDIDYHYERFNSFYQLYFAIIEELCDIENDPISPEEYQRFLDSIRFIPINLLYRD